MLYTTCMREIDETCFNCPEFEGIETHALNLAKSIKQTVKRNKQPELSGKDWAFIVACLESMEVKR